MKKKRKENVEFRFYEIPHGEAALILLGESWDRVYGHDEVDGNNQVILHFHNVMEIGFCKRGEGDMMFDDRVRRYKNGSITIIPENFPHLTVSDGEGTNFWEYIFFDPRMIVEELYPNNANVQREILHSINRGPLLIEAKDAPALERIVTAILEEAREDRPYGTRMVHFFITTLFIEIMRLNKELPYYPYESVKKNAMKHISLALSYAEEHYMDEIKVEDLAKVCNMSETHFRRVFEEYINMKPMDYVNLLRVQKACELLKNSNHSMDSIASKCGFTTVSTFNRNFNKFLGTSPYQWKLSPDNHKRRLMNYNVSVMPGW